MKKIFLTAFIFVCSFAASSVQAIRPEIAPDPLPQDYVSRRLCANKPVVFLYTDPSTESKVIKQAVYGDFFDYVEELTTWWGLVKGGWTKVKIAHTKAIGWVQDADIGFQTPISHLEQPVNRFIHVKQKSAPIYPKKSRQSKPIIVLPYSASVKTVNFKRDKETSWIEVHLLDGTRGYIRKNDAQLD